MMSDRESDDLPVDGIDVGQRSLHPARVRDRKLGVHRGVELLLRKQSPARENTLILLALELRTPRPVVKPFVSPEEKRRHRTAEAEGVAPVVRGDESPITADTDLAAPIGAIERELSIR